jgi:hypothetical protein
MRMCRRLFGPDGDHRAINSRNRIFCQIPFWRITIELSNRPASIISGVTSVSSVEPQSESRGITGYPERPIRGDGVAHLSCRPVTLFPNNKPILLRQPDNSPIIPHSIARAFYKRQLGRATSPVSPANFL